MAELDDLPIDDLMDDAADKQALQSVKYGNRQQVCPGVGIGYLNSRFSTPGCVH